MALIQTIRLDATAARREWQKIRDEPQKYSSATRKAVTGAAADVEKSASRMSAGLKAAFAGVAAVIATVFVNTLVQVQGKLFEIATAVEETASKFKITFGSQQSVVDQFVGTFGRLAGLTKTEGREITSTLGAVAQGFGASKESAADFSMQVVRAAADMASFNNTRLPDMLTAIRSGLAGEIEPLRRYGIELAAANVEAEALRMTGKATADELNQQEKVYARLALIQKQAAIQMGDLERTQNSLANQWRRFTGNIRGQAEEFSVGLIPVMTAVVSKLNELFITSTELAGAVSTARSEIQKLEDIEQAIDTVDELQNKTGLSARENDRLREALVLLQERFPEYIRTTNAAGQAMSFYTDALRGAVREQLAFQKAIETERLSELLERFEKSRAGLARVRAIQPQVAGQVESAEALVAATRNQSLLSRERRNAEVELGRMRNFLERLGEQALTSGARMRDATRALVELFKQGQDFNAERMIDALTATGLGLTEAQKLAADLIATYIQLEAQQTKVAEAPKPSLPGSVEDLPEGGIDPDLLKRLITSEDVSKAADVLERITEAQQIAARASEEEKRHLNEIFRLQDEIAALEEAGRILGSAAIREQLEFAQKRLEIERRELAHAEELRAKFKAAADAFAGLIGKAGMGAVEASGFKPPTTDKVFADLIEGGLISDKALRSVGMSADEVERLKKALTDSGKSGIKLREVLEGIAGAVRAVSRMVDVFGDLDDNVRRVADGVADVLDGFSNLGSVRSGLSAAGTSLSSAAGIAAQIPGFVGIAAGIVSVTAGFLSFLKDDSRARGEEMRQRQEERRQEAEEAKKFIDALRDNARAVSSAIERLIRATRIGGDVTGTTARQAGEAFGAFGVVETQAGSNIAGLMRQIEDLDLVLQQGGITLEEYTRQKQILLAQIEQEEIRLGKAYFTLIDQLEKSKLLTAEQAEEFRTLYLDLVQSGMTSSEAIKQIMLGTAEGMSEGLREGLLKISTGLGSFVDSVDGAIAAFDIFTRVLGQDLPEALLGFIDILEKIPDLSPEMKELLAEAKGLTADGELTEAEMARLKEIGKIIIERGLSGDSGFLAGLTPEDATRIGEAFMSASEGGAGEGATSRSVQFIRTITESQGNEMVLLLREISYYIKQMATGPMIPPSVQSVVSSVTTRPTYATPTLSSFTENNRSIQVDVGGVTVRGGGLTTREIEDIMIAIEEQLRRHRGFGR